MAHCGISMKAFLACFIVHCRSSTDIPTPSPSVIPSIAHTTNNVLDSGINGAAQGPTPISAHMTAAETSGTFSSISKSLVDLKNTSDGSNATMGISGPNTSIALSNHSTGNVSMVNSTAGNISTTISNATEGTPVFLNISSTQSLWMSPTVSITSLISGDTRSHNSTFFIEFKIAASHWNSGLTRKHNAYINKANRITAKIDQLYMNDTNYHGSHVLGFRKGVYVSIKVKFKPQGGLPDLDSLVQFLRSGGEDLKSDQVYFKVSQHANCIINYVDTRVCHCPSMTYTRQITCQRPDVFGGDDCPEKCWTGDTIIGTAACSWDDLDAYECAASPSRLQMLLLLFCLLVYCWLV